MGLVPGWGRSPGEGKGSPLQYSGLENPMDCIVQGVTKSRTRPSDFDLALCQTRMKGCRPVGVGSGLQRLEAVRRALISWSWHLGQCRATSSVIMQIIHTSLVGVIKNPPVSQCGRHRFSPWSGKILHAEEQLNLRATPLSLCSRARESQLLSLLAPTSKAQVPESPCSATREVTSMRSPCPHV